MQSKIFLIKKLFFPVSKSMKFTFIMQLEYCQKLEFEADPINKLKPLVKKKISKSMKFPFITQLKYCQTLDFEAGSINKLKPLIKRNYVCRFQKQ